MRRIGPSSIAECDGNRMNWALKPQSIRVTGSEGVYTSNQALPGLKWISTTPGVGWDGILPLARTYQRAATLRQGPGCAEYIPISR